MVAYLKMQNPGRQPRALSELLAECWTPFANTTSSLQAQIIVFRFGLPLSLASQAASLCLLEGRNG